MYEKIFVIPIYNVKVRVVICEDIVEYCKKRFDDSISRVKARLYDLIILKDIEDECDFIVIFEKDDIRESYINHESFHITYRTLRFVGIPLDESSEEAYAYLSDYIYLKIRRIVIEAKQLINHDSNT